LSCSFHEHLLTAAGRVFGDRIIDTRPEWRTFANDESGDDPSRVGEAADPLLHGSQLDTAISVRDGYSGRAKELSRTQAKTATNKADRNLLVAYKQIDTMCDPIGLPKVVSDIAKQVYKKVEDSRQLRGKSMSSIIAACIFIACRKANVPRTFGEIHALTHVSKTEIRRCFQAIEKLLIGESQSHVAGEISGVRTPGEGDYIPTVSANASDLMIRFCNRLQLPVNIQTVCVELAKRMEDDDILAGRSPVSIAAAGIFFVSWLMGKGKSVKEVGDVAGVSEGTIKGAYKVLYSVREKLVDTKWMEGGKRSMV
jgi:transcription initiation factor TFIIB